jgi:hypothetical protein
MGQAISSQEGAESFNTTSNVRINGTISGTGAVPQNGPAMPLDVTSVAGAFRTCRDWKIEPAFGGKSESGISIGEGPLVALRGRLAFSCDKVAKSTMQAERP